MRTRCDIARLRHGFGWRSSDRRATDQPKPPSVAVGLAVDMIGGGSSFQMPRR